MQGIVILALTSFHCTYFVTGLIGNILAITFFCTRKFNSYYFFLFQMACADLVTVFYFLTQIFKLVGGGYYYFGSFSCSYLSVIPDMVSPLVSHLILCATSYERYKRISQPFRAQISKTKITVLCFMIWIASYLLLLPFTLSRKIESNTNHTTKICKDTLLDNKLTIYHMAAWLSYVIPDCIIPFIFMTTFYWKTKKYIESSEIPSPTRDKDQALNRMKRRNDKALQSLRSLIILYFITAILFRFICMLLWIAVLFGDVKNSNGKLILNYLLLFVDCWVYTNNIANVFIYVRQIPEFRKFLKRLKRTSQ